ncbi:MAG: hypothetical protein GY755_12530 [Chloroflexi bacterium]|nr:hypothetical protein [Chloroflexota bacterium]
MATPFGEWSNRSFFRLATVKIAFAGLDRNYLFDVNPKGFIGTLSLKSPFAG